MPETGASPFSIDYGSPPRALLAGAWEAFGAPALVLGASYIGFGSLLRDSGLGLGLGLLSTLTMLALPGQVALVELYAVGASLLAIAIAVALTNARMMPMTMSLMPLLRLAGRARWRDYLAAHLVAVTGWAVSMVRCPDMPPPQRMSFFVGFASVIMLACLVGTVVGFLASRLVPTSVSLGLMFLNPAYFVLLFLTDLRTRWRVLALVLGAVLAPWFHWLTPTWGLLLTGAIGGTLAFVVHRAIRIRRV